MKWIEMRKSEIIRTKRNWNEMKGNEMNGIEMRWKEMRYGDYITSEKNTSAVLSPWETKLILETPARYERKESQ